MKNKLFYCFFLINFLYFSNFYAELSREEEVQAQEVVQILEKLKKEEKYQKLVDVILQQEGIDANAKEENKPEQKRLFKKRDLISLLSFLGFSGINFGFFYKLFTGSNNKKTQIAQLRTQQQAMQEKLNSYEESLDKLQLLQKDLEQLKQEKEKLETRLVANEDVFDKSLT